MEKPETYRRGEGAGNKTNEPEQISILTHRGLDPAKENYFSESSREAFADHVARGFGLEFDLQFTKDGTLVVFHDSDLKRLTKGRHMRMIGEVHLRELLQIDWQGCPPVSFSELLQMIAENPNSCFINAIHITSKLQEPQCLGRILEELREVDPERLVLFDLKIPAARYLKGGNPHLHLAASVAHPYDIERYTSAVDGTLLPLERVIENRDIYDWVWLDEWDRTDKGGGTKSLYNKDTFERLRNTGFKIALVTPELHRTSPGLRGGEAHQDARSKEALLKRITEIIKLRPDAMCTDYPDLVAKIVNTNIHTQTHMS